MNNQKQHLIANALLGIVEKARHGCQRTRIGLMAYGSELGSIELLKGALQAEQENPNLQVVPIGTPIVGFEGLDWIECPECESDINSAMQKALEEKNIAGAVGMHYPFPIGVATIGRVITPAFGKPMFIASCTGTTATNRSEAMLRNAIYGIATAKAAGIKNPTVAFLNLDGAGAALRAIRNMQAKGYDITLGKSQRGDGGTLLRGNDAVAGSVDILVCDTLTGNALVKVFSTFTSGGQYESVGFGYGASVGEGWNEVVSIISRASGAPVVAAALSLTARMALNNLPVLLTQEMQHARACAFDAEVENLQPQKIAINVQKPPTVPVDAEISGVDVLDMDTAAQGLWQAGIYAETAMGCTGPVVRVASSAKEQAEHILKNLGLL